MSPLDEEFHRIRDSHRCAIKLNTARVTLGPSVVRVFAAGTRERMIRALVATNLEALRSIRARAAFERWFDTELARFARVIARLNPANDRIRPGLKWGHASKVLAIYVRDVVLRSRYFPTSVSDRLEPLLHVPIDGVVMDRLAELDVSLSFDRINQIDSRRKFYGVQMLLEASARRARVPRIWFDDNWADRG